MIIYHKTKEDFSNDVLSNRIDEIIAKHLLKTTNAKVSPNELRSFKNSLAYMDRVLADNQIPNDAGISIEYHIPQTSKRIDFLISGSNENSENVIIIELKQWETCEITDKDGIVNTRFQYGSSDTSHPSYQAYSYAALLRSFNATVDEENIQLYPCAYLHNYYPDDVIKNDFYSYYIEQAPAFLKPDALELRNFIKKFIKKGDHTQILFRIDNGKIRPTKSLADSLQSMLKGNQEFLMIDDQKVLYENAKKIALNSHEKNKNVIIVQGGPGTGKSVVSINLLVELNRSGKMAQYVTKTSAPREVYFNKLLGEHKKIELKSLFVGSGSFMKAPKNSISTLIVDEAHRLTEKTGFLKQGDNQIKEIINASNCAIFFIDEDQRVHFNDYGEVYVIEEIAKQLDCKIHYYNLESQFRCNGSDGYLAWVDNVLQIRNTANQDFKDFEYDFKVFNNPKELQQAIYEKNKINNKARLVAGYCWTWKSKKDNSLFDIEFPEYNFKMKWNMVDYGGTFMIDSKSVTEVGCIHTAQGLEADYIGVIIGNDLIIRNGEVLVDPNARAKEDRTIFGWKGRMKKDPEQTKELLKVVIKNTYRTLMTRGMKGCYIYCTDKETNEYFKNLIKRFP